MAVCFINSSALAVDRDNAPHILGDALQTFSKQKKSGTEKSTKPEGNIVLAQSRSQQRIIIQVRRAIQRALNTKGFPVGRPDGKFGPRTRRAIAGFQNSIGATPTGRLTPDEVRMLLAPGQAQSQTGVSTQPDRVLSGSPPAGGTVGASASQAPLTSSSQANLGLARTLGIPILHGRLAIMDDTSAMNAELRYKQVRFAWQRFLERAVFAESPGLVEEHDVAKIIAKRHLSNSDKTALAAAVGHGKLGDTHRESFGFFFSNALDEFQKKQFIEQLKTTYLPRLAKSAPTWPVRIVNIKRIGVSKYDFETRKIKFGIGKDRLRLDLPKALYDVPSEYFMSPKAPLPLKAWPTSISLPEAQAKGFLDQFRKVDNDTRVAYMAVFGTMKKTKNGFETQVEKLSLFADPLLKKEMVQFNLNPLHKGAAVAQAKPRYDLLKETSDGVREHAPIANGHMTLYLLRYFSDLLTEEDKKRLYFDVGKSAAAVELKAKKVALGSISDRNRRRRRKEAVAIVSFEQMVRAGDTDAQRAFAQTVLMRKWDLSFTSKYIPANIQNMARVHLVLTLFELQDFQGRNLEFVVSEKLDIVKQLIALLVEELPSKTFVTSWTEDAKVNPLKGRLIFNKRNLLKPWEYRAFASSAKEGTSTVLPDEAAPFPIYEGFYNWVGRMPSYLEAKFSKNAYRMPARTTLFRNPWLRNYPEALAGGHILNAFYHAGGTERIRSKIMFTPNRPLDLSQLKIEPRRLEIIANSISPHGSELRFLLAFNIDKFARHEQKNGIAMLTTLGKLYLLDKKGKVVLVTEFPDPAAGVENKTASVKTAKAHAGNGFVEAEQSIGPKGMVDLDVLGIKLGMPLSRAKSILQAAFKGANIKKAAKKSGGFTMTDVAEYRCRQAQQSARQEAEAKASFLGRQLTPEESSELDEKMDALCTSVGTKSRKWDGKTLFKLAHSIEVDHGQGIVDKFDLFVPGNPAKKKNIIAIGRAISEKGRRQFVQAAVRKYGEAFIKMPTAWFWFADPRFRRRESIFECELRHWPYISSQKLDHAVFKKDCGHFVALRTDKRTQMLLVDSGFLRAAPVQAKKPVKPAPVIKF